LKRRPRRSVEPLNDLLQDIAFHLWEGEHGAFLQAFAGLYFHADEKNRELLKPVWQELIEKFLVKKHVVVLKEAEV